MTLHDFFLYAAVLGGALFLAQLVLSALGAGDADIDFAGHHAGHDVGRDHGAQLDSAHHTSSDTAFKMLSLQGLSAFFTMFGLTGLALHDQSGLDALRSIAGAFAAGWFSTFVIAHIFRAARKLEGSGTLNLKNARGAEGTVYLRIAPAKPGKITVTVQGRQIEAEAVSHEKTFETGQRVRVLRALPDGTLLVGTSDSQERPS